MALNDLLNPKTILPVAGAVVGGVVTKSPAGAAAGASVGQAAASLLDFSQPLPETVGPTGAQKSSLAAQQQLLERSAAQRGTSAAQVSNIALLAQQQQAQQFAALNTLKQTMFSPLEQELIGKRLMSDIRQGQVNQMRALQAFNADAESRNITQTSRLAASTFAQGSEIQRIESVEEQQRREMKLIRLQNLQSMIGTSVKAIGIASKANQLQARSANQPQKLSTLVDELDEGGKPFFDTVDGREANLYQASDYGLV